MRIRDLDLLRGLAILGVLLRHSAWDNRFTRTGWAGVDLFFVLSGFLVSGLLFKEYKEYGKARIGRFLVRRGFKIYPTFYLFLLISVVFGSGWFHVHYKTHNIVSEALFLQSYLPGCFIHTWSLAIEEHFYILLSLFIWLAIKFGWLGKQRLMISILIGSIVLVGLMRLQYVYVRRDKDFVPLFYTHLRMDGLLLGVLVAYLVYFRAGFVEFLKKHSVKFSLLAISMIVPIFILKPGGFFMNTIGFNEMHIGFALLVSLAGTSGLVFPFRGHWVWKPILRVLALIGVYSYSIYVWHLFFLSLVLKLGLSSSQVILALLAEIVGGVLISLLIEQLFLRIRDRYFS